jgi:hypothetical protein
MAAEPTAKPTPPPPPPKAPDRVVTPQKPEGKSGFDPLRPFRLAKGFIGGTLTSTLDNTSNWGRKAMKIGAIVGLAVAFAPALGMTGGVAAFASMLQLNLFTGPLLGGAAGLLAGAATGAAVGATTGGIQGVWRVQRGEKYAEDLRAKQVATNSPRAQAARTVDYREVYRARQARQNFQTGIIQEQQRQFVRDEGSGSYWQDFVSGPHRDGGRGF